MSRTAIYVENRAVIQSTSCRGLLLLDAPRLAILALSLVVPGGGQAQGLRLDVLRDRPSYFEGEPVHVALELRNLGPAPAVVRPFALESLNPRVSMTGVDGAEIPHVMLVADKFVLAPIWDTIAPGDSRVVIIVLQDHWGYELARRGVFLGWVPVGRYEFSATFRPDHGHQAVTGAAAFEVIPPTTEEMKLWESFSDVQASVYRAANSSHVTDMLNWVEARISMPEALPFNAFLLNQGIQTAKARGVWLRTAEDRLATLRVSLALRSPRSSSGAMVIASLRYDGQDVPPDVVRSLGTDLAGRAARAPNLGGPVKRER